MIRLGIACSLKETIVHKKEEWQMQFSAEK